MSHIVHCRICKEEIDIDQNTGWMMPSKNYYYHCDCYHEWLSKKEERLVNIDYADDEWKALLFDYLLKEIKLPNINFEKITSQWNNLLKNTKQRFTPKGIYFAILYYYEVVHGDINKALGGIGIVSSIYRDSAEYWINREHKRVGTLDAIVKQMQERSNRETLIINHYKNSGQNRARFSLDDV